MTHQEAGPAPGDARNGTAANGAPKFLAFCFEQLDGTTHHESEQDTVYLIESGATHLITKAERRRIADFFAFIHPCSLDPRATVIAVGACRHGEFVTVVMGREDFENLSWVARVLGPEAAASITDGEALKAAIRLLSAAHMLCKSGPNGSCCHGCPCLR